LKGPWTSLWEKKKENLQRKDQIFFGVSYSIFLPKKNPFEKMIYKKTIFGRSGISNCQGSSCFAICDKYLVKTI
jgi:hypothetical protein